MRGPVRVRVIPVRARRMRLRRCAGLTSIPLDVAEPMLVLRDADPLVRADRATAGSRRRLAHLTVCVRQNPQERVVAARAVRVEPGFDVQAVRVQIRRVRSVRDVHVTAETARLDQLDRAALEELVEVTEDRASVRRGGAGVPHVLLHPAERGIEHVGTDFEGIGCGALGYAAQVRSEVIPDRYAKTLVAAHADRGAGTGAVEAEQRREAIAGRRGARRMRVADDVDRERLVGPVGRTPDPRLRPVLGDHRRRVCDVLGCGRLRRLWTLPRTGCLAFACAERQAARTEGRDARCPQLQQLPAFQTARSRY